MDTMERFRFLPHTADAKFQAFGKTLEEAFSNAALALSAFLVGEESISKIATKKKAKISLKSSKEENLLVDFLNEILYLLESKHLLPAKIEELTITRKEKQLLLNAKVVGDDFRNYKTHGHIKAATYHDLKITQRKNGWMVQIVIDV